MLCAIEGSDLKEITRIPHEDAFRLWMSRLSAEDYDAVCQELRRRMDKATIHTSSWIPGADWRGTVFGPLYEACARDERSAGHFFGIILWKLMKDDHRVWSFGNYEKDGVPIEGITYFQLQVDPRAAISRSS